MIIENRTDSKITNNKSIIVFAENNNFLPEAEKLAKHLRVSVTTDTEMPGEFELILKIGDSGLVLTDGKMEVKGDFTGMIPRLKKGNLQGEFLVKAAKIKGESKTLTVVDATAGLGEDSLILAAAGFNVKLYEYDPVIAALLRDSINRAKDIPALSEAVSRMELFEGNSIEKLYELDYDPDIVLLDPMFPERQKSALVKKKFQLIHHLEKPCDDEEGLLKAAIAAKPRKIVIKRPIKGAFLAGIKPSYSIKGKAIRYDCLVFTW